MNAVRRFCNEKTDIALSGQNCGIHSILCIDMYERYSRQTILDSWTTETQEKLLKATVFIAGAGGLGSPVAYYLAAAGIGTLRICDSDVVDVSNLNRQILHSQADIGRGKTESAREKLERLNPDIRIIPLTARIDDDSISELVADAQIMVDCLDNFDTRYVLNRFSVRMRVPFVHAGVYGLSGQLSFISPPDTPCLACIIPKAPQKTVVPVLGATAGIMGALEALEVVKFLTGTGSVLKHKLLFFDGSACSMDTLALSRNPDCPVCGSINREATRQAP